MALLAVELGCRLRGLRRPECSVQVVLGLFLYVWAVYNFVFLRSVLPADGRSTHIPAFAAIFNALWVLAVWSYLRTHFTEPGYVTEEWKRFVRENNKIVVVHAAGGKRKEWIPGAATTTERSSEPRPERAHYCEECDREVLRMDHHCPLSGNCIGFWNYKFFIQMSMYTTCASLTALVTMTPELVSCLREDALRFSWCTERTWASDLFLSTGVAVLYIFLFLAALMSTHFSFAIENMTSIERKYDNMANPYDHQSCLVNLAQTFGAFGLDWFVPIVPRRPLSDLARACAHALLAAPAACCRRVHCTRVGFLEVSLDELLQLTLSVGLGL
eukprot:TRINITY_DN25633_c0_g1_i1.p1 TRINITY_DN25633_c0_g1~~TRINITY_DN25633_c0_g1_i1.p1  ORF type:complete len:329 (+),score=43.32 TRINITY_DN25633_c0_g1_i1:82-1068(+)